MKKYIYKVRGFLISRFESVKNFKAASLIFQCNVCGQTSITPMDNLGRETVSCLNCGSTVRMRSVIHALSTAMFKESLALPDFPVQRHVQVIGLSDWDGYAIPLAGKLNYTNMFYHKMPQLDITSIDPSLENTLNILISSDVFEHVAPPISVAFENSFRLLKSGGVLILTVPYTIESQTKEHFPELYKYEIRRQGDRSILHNITRDGREQIYTDLNFHGGAGATLEMRRFSLEGLLTEIRNAGFNKIEILSTPNFKYGVYSNYRWSLPIIARKP